ncbi:protein Skeletor, isoforms B/C isoform X5 [Leptidea sinapis]|uniref:protein Skeletor, isoforms B/C isoform X5 n=1 Tax=Leptidea sinapis TaxID=189913 RepID=UPI0021C26923|nr:protein Skeletor, isoforms B/C isoform X5 [Leptidea sinapis]
MLLVAVSLLLLIGGGEGHYFGKEVGPLSELHHGVKGRVFAVDSRTLYLQDLHYDGEGPAAYFYVGTGKSPSATGATRLRDERGGTGPLRRYRGESITLSLPDGKTLKDFKTFFVWCDDYAVNFGSVEIPRGVEFPRPAKVGALRGVHGVASDSVVVVDAQTLLVPNFSYDGEAPDAKFWVGRGEKPSPEGIRIPDENGKETPLRKYDKKTIVLTLPGELTVFDIGHFAIWCEAFTVNFGHIVLPRAALANVPPSLKMLGVSPQSRNKALAGEAGRPPARSRKPIAHSDATTYRPPRLGVGPPAPLEEPSRPAHVHRRADIYSPPADQRDPTTADSSLNQLQNNSHPLQPLPGDTNEMDGLTGETKDLKTTRYVLNRRPAPAHDDVSFEEHDEPVRYDIEIKPQTVAELNPETRELLYQQYLYEEQRRALEYQLSRYRELQARQAAGFRPRDLDLIGRSK